MMCRCGQTAGYNIVRTSTDFVPCVHLLVTLVKHPGYHRDGRKEHLREDGDWSFLAFGVLHAHCCV